MAEQRVVTFPGRHEPVVAEHFDTLEQQHSANVLGMWIFLATELMLFGGLFLGYAVYRALYPVAFAEASHHQNLVAGSINTAVLLISSLAMALAVRNAQVGNRRALALLLLVGAALGTVFLGIKAFEYFQHYQEGLAPGVRYTYDGADPAHAALFFFLYFVMTGLHAVHLSIGVLLVLIVAFRAWRGNFLGERYTGVELTALYWHFVDIVWLFLFPLFYLLR